MTETVCVCQRRKAQTHLSVGSVCVCVCLHGCPLGIDLIPSSGSR